jgi:hypothetical protein
VRRVGAAVIAAALLAGCSPGGKRAATTTTAPSAIPFVLPSFLPTGFAVKAGSVQPIRRAAEGYAVAVGRATGGGAFDDVVLANVQAATADRAVAPGEQNTSVDIDGVTARLHDGPLVGASVDFFTRGMYVAVSGKPGASDAVVAVARALHLPASGKAGETTFGGPPAGFATIDDVHITSSDVEAGETIDAAGPPGVISIHVIATKAPLIFAVGGGDHVAPTTIRGHTALVSVRSRSLPGGNPIATTTLAWFEKPSVAISILGETTAEQLSPVAAGIRTVTPREWRTNVPLVTTTTQP